MSKTVEWVSAFALAAGTIGARIVAEAGRADLACGTLNGVTKPLRRADEAGVEEEPMPSRRELEGVFISTVLSREEDGWGGVKPSMVLPIAVRSGVREREAGGWNRGRRALGVETGTAIAGSGGLSSVKRLATARFAASLGGAMGFPLEVLKSDPDMLAEVRGITGG